MNKTDLITYVSEKAGLTKVDASKAIDSVFGGIMGSLKKGTPCAFGGFGSFKVTKRKAREGRNPRTGETIKINASTSASFSPSKNLKDLLNN